MSGAVVRVSTHTLQLQGFCPEPPPTRTAAVGADVCLLTVPGSFLTATGGDLLLHNMLIQLLRPAPATEAVTLVTVEQGNVWLLNAMLRGDGLSLIHI